MGVRILPILCILLALATDAPFPTERLTHLLVQIEPPHQPLHATLSVDDALLTREKRVALVAYLHAELRHRRACRINRPARAYRRRFRIVCRMYPRFHFSISFLSCPSMSASTPFVLSLSKDTDRLTN